MRVDRTAEEETYRMAPVARKLLPMWIWLVPHVDGAPDPTCQRAGIDAQRDRREEAASRGCRGFLGTNRGWSWRCRGGCSGCLVEANSLVG
jgi:hypothetical protein